MALMFLSVIYVIIRAAIHTVFTKTLEPIELLQVWKHVYHRKPSRYKIRLRTFPLALATVLLVACTKDRSVCFADH